MGKWNQEMVREGRCCNCGGERDPDSKRYCEKCLKTHARQSRDWAKAHPDKIRKANREYRPVWRSGNKPKWNAQRKRHNTRTRKYADNHGLLWGPEDENWLWKNRNMRQRELAKILGRTIIAVRNRLRILRKRHAA